MNQKSTSVVKETKKGKRIKDLERRFNIFLNSSHDLISEVDTNANILFINQKSLDILGYKPDELIGKNAFQYFHPDEIENIRLSFVRMIESRESVSPSYRFKHKNGSWKWLKGFISIYEDASELKVISFAQDITDKIEADIERKRIEDKYKDLVEKVGVAINETDITGKIIFYNDHFLKILGDYKGAGKELTINNIVDKKDIKRVLGYHNKRVEGKSSVSEYEFRVLMKDGSFKYISVSAIPIFKNGQISGTRSYLWDITERKIIENKLKESQQILEALMDNIPGLAYRCNTDKDWNMLFISQGCKMLTGYEAKELLPPDNVITFNDLILPDYKENIKEYAKKEIMQNGSFTISFPIKTKSGEIKWVWEQGKIIKNNNDIPDCIEGLIIDITERVKTEQALKRSEEALRNSDATKNKFFSIIAHDLQNPFNAIKQFSGQILDDYYYFETRERMEFIRNIKEASENALNLLHNLLQWSLSQTEKIQVNLENLNLSKVVQEIFSLLNSNAKNKDINLVSLVPTEMLVNADHKMLCTILLNLISNGIKYTPNGGEILVNAEIQDDLCNISVKDNGRGISEEEMDQLFKIDRKFKTEGTEEECGNGLGLILCKEFIEKLGGSIYVASEVGEGSIFSFSFPYKG
ncbi:PAS domain S-box protein [Bacteroidota bacterium]